MHNHSPFTRPLRRLAMAVVGLATLAASPLCMAAQGTEPSRQAPIVASIEADSTITLEIPEALMLRLEPSGDTEPAEADEAAKEEQPAQHRRTTAAGYRVQVFSDNNPRTARNEARSKESRIASAFPQWRTYKKYSAPYWRLRVGDFRSRREADEAAEALRRAFPAMAKEIRVVNDRVNITGD